MELGRIWLWLGVFCGGCEGGASGTDGSGGIDGDAPTAAGDWVGVCDEIDTTDALDRVLSFEVTILDNAGELTGAGAIAIDGDASGALDLEGTREGDQVEIRLSASYEILSLAGSLEGDEMVLDATLCETCSGAWYTVCRASR